MDRGAKELSAAERARWLSELSEALDAAQQLMSRLGIDRAESLEGMELYLRIEAARLQVHALRLGRGRLSEQTDPERTESLPWQRAGNGGGGGV